MAGWPTLYFQRFQFQGTIAMAAGSVILHNVLFYAHLTIRGGGGEEDGWKPAGLGLYSHMVSYLFSRPP